jgi:hypothetical protein
MTIVYELSSSAITELNASGAYSVSVSILNITSLTIIQVSELQWRSGTIFITP